MRKTREKTQGFALGLFSDRTFHRDLTRLTLPIAIQSLMLAAVAAADAFMLGGVEQNAMAAVSLATQIQFIQNMLLTGFTAAEGILGAQYWGKRDEGALSHIFGLALRWSGLTSLVFFAGCMLLPRQLMLLFTNEEALLGIGVRYLRIAGWSYLMTGVSQCFLTLMKVSDHAAASARISSVTVVLNIILNAVFIFGLHLDVRGAAIATLIARTVELVWAAALSTREGYLKPRLRDVWSRHPVLAADFRRCMLPILGAGLLWGVGFTSYTAFMGHMGTDAAAANSIASVIRDLVCCVCNGLASGGGILVGNELGAGRLERGRLYGDRLTVIALLCGVLSALVMLALTPLALRVVRLTDGARAELTGMMLVMSVYMIGRALNGILINGIFAAGGDTLFDMYSLVVTMWMIAVPLAAAGTFWLHWPVVVVYACTCLDEVGKIPWVLLHYRRYLWVKDLTRENV